MQNLEAQNTKNQKDVEQSQCDNATLAKERDQALKSVKSELEMLKNGL